MLPASTATSAADTCAEPAWPVRSAGLRLACCLDEPKNIHDRRGHPAARRWCTDEPRRRSEDRPRHHCITSPPARFPRGTGGDRHCTLAGGWRQTDANSYDYLPALDGEIA